MQVNIWEVAKVLTRSEPKPHLTSSCPQTPVFLWKFHNLVTVSKLTQIAYRYAMFPQRPLTVTQNSSTALQSALNPEQ